MIFEGTKILVLDDDVSFLEQMPDILGGYGRLDCYRTIDQGLAAVESTYYDIAILDLNFENDSRTGLHVFQKIQAMDRGVDVIMVTGETDPRRIFEFVNAGIHHFIPKPINVDEIRDTVSRILADREVRRRRTALSQDIGRGKDTPALVGSSSQMNHVRDQIALLVANNARDILIQGETGTGKEVVAQYIARSADSIRPMVAINCAALTESLIQSELFGHAKGAFTGADRMKIGIFEAAEGGYVFLDEIGDMPLTQQPKLLRTLQERKIIRVGELEEREVKFRTISATHKDLKEAASRGEFREDLYYRISKATIELPPLRERIDDIPELVEHFLRKHPKQCEIDSRAMNLLLSYAWPGNVRQLESAIEGMVIRAKGNRIQVTQVIQCVPELAGLTSGKIKKSIVGTYGMKLIAEERARFEKAIIDANGDRTEAAKALGIPRTTFFRKAKDLGLVRSRQEQSLSGLRVQLSAQRESDANSPTQ